MQRATSQCDMNYPTGRQDRCHTTLSMQHATQCNIVCTPCSIKRARTVRSKRCNKHHTPCHVQRTPCNVLMQHAQLSAARIAHRRRACDAAALELDRPTTHRHHATRLQTAAPLRRRPDQPPPATRTQKVEVLKIATDLNVTAPLRIASTPPSCTPLSTQEGAALKAPSGF
jgi:hypothetical protein